LGHSVEVLGDGRDLLRRLLDAPPDFVFNIAEGQGVGRCREARVPAVLEMLGIPCTGSDPLNPSVALDKECTKKVGATAGGMGGPGVVARARRADGKLPADGWLTAARKLTYPVIVKPAWEGSSKGIRTTCLVKRQEELLPVVTEVAGQHHQPLLI